MAYHVLIDGDQKGPFETASVAEMIANGEISPDTLVWTAGMDDWQPAESVAEIASAVGPAAPEAAAAAPPPPSSGAPAMAAQGTGRLAIGAVFGQAFRGFTHQPFRALLLTFVGLVLPIALIFAVIFALGFSESFVMEDSNAVLRPDADPVVVIALSVIMALIYAGFYGGLIAVMIGLARREPVGLGRLFSGFGRLLPLLLTFIVIMFMILPGIFSFLIFRLDLMWVIEFIIMIALIMVSIFLAISFYIAPLYVMDERIGPFAAIGRSFRGVLRAGWWRVFFTLLVTFSTVMGVTIGVIMMLGLTTALTATGFGAGLEGDVHGELNPVAMFIAMGPMTLGTLLVYLLGQVAIGLVSASIYDQARAGGD